MIESIDLKFTQQSHYADGGIDTMELLDAKLSTDQYIGLVVGDVVRYTLRYLVTRNTDDLEKALTMLAWGVNRIREEKVNG